MVQNRIVET